MTKTQAQVVYKLKFQDGIIRHNSDNGQILLESWESWRDGIFVRTGVRWDTLTNTCLDALLNKGLIKFSRKDWFVNEYVLNA